ncbi:MAG TPA: phenylalanine--tRNA ligase subunit alpha, partial [Patescibacteria group bacterium]|nr:phenylalanine--tRNA ligase subunit alpha [Patescibacteria group bacterium]
MKEDLINLKNQALARISEANNLDELEQIRIDLFGRSGKITLIIKELRNLKPEEKKQIGILINEIKKTLDEFIQTK